MILMPCVPASAWHLFTAQLSHYEHSMIADRSPSGPQANHAPTHVRWRPQSLSSIYPDSSNSISIPQYRCGDRYGNVSLSQALLPVIGVWTDKKNSPTHAPRGLIPQTGACSPRPAQQLGSHSSNLTSRILPRPPMRLAVVLGQPSRRFAYLAGSNEPSHEDR